jgi:hypothetical protein
MAHSQFVFLAAVCFEPGLRAQDGASLRLVDERLQDAHRLAEHHAFVFVGGISRMETVAVRAAVRASKKNWNTAAPLSYGTTQRLTLKTKIR